MKSKISIEVRERPQKYQAVVINKINNTIVEKPSVSFIEKFMSFVRK